MPSTSKETTASNGKLFSEIKNKCAVLGINVNEESFLANSDKYIEIAKKYDDAAEDFLFSNNKRHRQISKELVANDHVPEFMAYIKAKQRLLAEFNEQVTTHVIKVIDDATIKELATTVAFQQQDNLRAERERQQAEAKRQREEAERKAAEQKARLMEEQRQQAEAKRQREEAERKAAEQKARLMEEQRQQAEAKRQREEAERKAKEQKARLMEEQRQQAEAKHQREEAERKAAEQKARLMEEQRRAAEEKARIRAEEQRKRAEAERKAKEKKARMEAKEKSRAERKAKFRAKWQKVKDSVFSISSSLQTMGKTISGWRNLFTSKADVVVQTSLAYKEKLLKSKKEKYRRKYLNLKNAKIKSLKIAAASIPVVAGGYYLYDITQNSVVNSDAQAIHQTPVDTLTQAQKEELAWIDEANSDRDIDDTAFLNDTLSYGVLASSPNMPLFSKCFDECNRRLGEEKSFGITNEMISDFKKENPAMAQRYSKFLSNSQNLIGERIVAKAQIFDKYDIASFHNPNIASYMYNLVLQQNNDTTIHRVQALADGIRDFYNLCNKELSDTQMEALDNLSDFQEQKIHVNDWRQVISAVNNIIDPAEEKSLFNHIKNSVADSYVDLVIPESHDALCEKKIALNEEQKFYSSFVPVIGADTYKADSTETKRYFPDSDINFAGITFDFADNDMYKIKPIPTTDFAEQTNAQFKADMEAFKNLHMQAYHDMYIKMQYGQKIMAYGIANKALRNHKKSALVKGLHCSGTSIACLCIASDKLKEIRPDNYVSKAVDMIVKNLTNANYCNSLQTDLNNLAIKTLGRDVAKDLYNSSSSNLLRECSRKMRENPRSFMYVWTVRYRNPKTGAVKYHHQACLPALNNNVPYTYGAFNGNHWDTNDTKFRDGLSGRTFDMGQFVYKLAELEKNRDIEKNIAKDMAQNQTIAQYNIVSELKQNIR